MVAGSHVRFRREFTAEDREVLQGAVKLAQRRHYQGSRGDWRQYLESLSREEAQVLFAWPTEFSWTRLASGGCLFLLEP